MSDAFLGEIRIFAGNYAVEGWEICNGQLLSLSSNTSLFSILGTTYGGDGMRNFGLPELQGRATLAAGSAEGLTTRHLGAMGGHSAVTLTVEQLPRHDHAIYAAASGKTGQKYSAGSTHTNVLGSGASGDKVYGPASNAQMSDAGITVMGNGQPHNNMDPYLVMTYMISTTGMFPSRG
jgi:microcystin-dependent protein